MTICSYVYVPTIPIIGIFHDADIDSYNRKYYHLYALRGSSRDSSNELGAVFYVLRMYDNSGKSAFSPDEFYYDDAILLSPDNLNIKYKAIMENSTVTCGLNKEVLLLPDGESDIISSSSGWHFIRDGRVLFCCSNGSPYNQVITIQDEDGVSQDLTVGDEYYRATNSLYLPTPYFDDESDEMVLKEVNGEREVRVTAEQNGCWIPEDFDDKTGCGVYYGIGLYSGKTLTVGFPIWKSANDTIYRSEECDSSGYYSYGKIKWSEAAGAYVLGSFGSPAGWWQVSSIQPGQDFTLTFTTDPQYDTPNQDNITYYFEDYGLITCPDLVYVTSGVTWV